MYIYVYAYRLSDCTWIYTYICIMRIHVYWCIYIHTYMHIPVYWIHPLSYLSCACSFSRARALSLLPLPFFLLPSPTYASVAIRPLTQSHWSRRTWRKCGGVPRNQWTVSLHLVNSFEHQSHVSHCLLHRVYKSENVKSIIRSQS